MLNLRLKTLQKFLNVTPAEAKYKLGPTSISGKSLVIVKFVQ